MPKLPTILLAEDEILIRNMVESLFGSLGYGVISAVDGLEAVQKFRENSDKIDLLLFDIKMPKKSGLEAYDEISLVKAEMKVIFTSGYTYAPEDVHLRARESPNVMWLSKPYLTSQLLELVQKMLDREI